eukprot:gene27390-34098_t
MNGEVVTGVVSGYQAARAMIPVVTAELKVFKAAIVPGHSVVRSFTAGSDHYYSGQWVQNVQDGHGVEVNAVGIYSGGFVEGKRHGRGTMKFAEGDVYCGDWVNGLVDGCGYDVVVNSGTYLGEFKAGKAHGHGKQKYSDGRTVLEGQGVYTYAGDGSVYTGQFKDDQRHGRGELVYADGRVYNCLWDNARMEGVGTI